MLLPLHFTRRHLVLLAVALTLAAASIPSCTCCRSSTAGSSRHSARYTAAVAGYQLSAPLPGETLPYEMHDTCTSGPPVLLLHDILGPRPNCLELGRHISALPQRYCVYVPVLHGQFGCGSSFLGSLVSKHTGWSFYTADCDQPALPDLERLCASLSARHQGRRVIVIGNCSTGGAAVALLRSPHVASAITSQPALPFAFVSTAHKRALDVSFATLHQAARRAATLPQPALLGFRYYRDSVCTELRFERLRSEFGSSFKGVQLCDFKLCEQDELPATFLPVATTKSTLHSVLIPAEDLPALPPSSEEFAAIKTFLAQHSGL